MLTESDLNSKESAMPFRLRGQEVHRLNAETILVKIKTEGG